MKTFRVSARQESGSEDIRKRTNAQLRTCNLTDYFFAEVLGRGGVGKENLLLSRRGQASGVREEVSAVDKYVS